MAKSLLSFVFQESFNRFFVRLLHDVFISDLVQPGLPACPSQHPRLRSSFFFMAQHSERYVIAGLIIVLNTFSSREQWPKVLKGCHCRQLIINNIYDGFCFVCGPRQVFCLCSADLQHMPLKHNSPCFQIDLHLINESWHTTIKGDIPNNHYRQFLGCQKGNKKYLSCFPCRVRVPWMIPNHRYRLFRPPLSTRRENGRGCYPFSRISVWWHELMTESK